MTELKRMLKEIEEVYQDELEEGYIEEYEDKERFVDETVGLYIEKINMGRYDKLEIFTELARGGDLKQAVGWEREDSLDKIISDYIYRHLKNKISNIVH